MRKMFRHIIITVLLGIIIIGGCQNSNSVDMDGNNVKKVLFLHHSTGQIIWRGENNLISKIKGRLGFRGAVEKWFGVYNKNSGKKYDISEMAYPSRDPYGWKNYPFDYYNIWVKHGDTDYYMEQPTLKILAPQYDMIIFKHCFPVSKIVFDGTPDVDSERRMIENYKLQYNELKKEMHKYKTTLFLLWTPPALTEQATNPEAAAAATDFSEWIVREWDQPGDNIFIWDFRSLETKGGDYILPEYATGERDSHPSHLLAGKTYPLFCKRIVDVLEGRGDVESVMGE
ncbi:hypothetical protein ACT29H_11060 [Thermophagus sp. OGC60D27]|uniref:hypothetical protein n=1 Tax=Thermophagus sp. OGC60D27 TaxID=3458415 RepID=UPI0040383219